MKHDYELRAGKIPITQCAQFIKNLPIHQNSRGHLMSKKKKNYIIRSYKGSRELFNYFWKLTKCLKLDNSDPKQLKLRKAYHRFLLHVFIGTKTLKNKKKYPSAKPMIPVCSDLIRNKLHRKLKTKKLEQHKLIKIKNHHHGPLGGKSREFRLCDKIFNEAIQIEADSVISHFEQLSTHSETQPMVNLFTAKNQYTKKHSEMCLYTNSTKMYKIPDLLKNSIKKSLDPFPFNPHKIIPWFKRLKAKAARSEKTFKKAQKEYNKARKDYMRANGLFIATTSSLTAIINQGIRRTKNRTKDNKEIWEYDTAYSIQEFGRVSEIHGGFQILSKVGKKHLMENVPNLFNYDLKNSQAYILLLEFESCDIHCKWLKRYLGDSKSKERYAKKIGISVGCWKDCFYATVMGAVAKGRGAPYHTIYSEVKNKKRAAKLHKKFVKIITPLYDASEKWRAYLLNSNEKKHTYLHKSAYHWRNICGMKFRKNFAIHKDDSVDIIETSTGEILSWRQIPAVKRRLAAFFLQGREACYIHNLTILCKKAGIPVYKNEHDGLITGREIPLSLQKKAAGMAGVKGAILEIKDICSLSKESSVDAFIDS